MERYFSLKSFIVTMKSIINKFIAPYFAIAASACSSNRWEK